MYLILGWQGIGHKLHGSGWEAPAPPPPSHKKPSPLTLPQLHASILRCTLPRPSPGSASHVFLVSAKFFDIWQN